MWLIEATKINGPLSPEQLNSFKYNKWRFKRRTARDFFNFWSLESHNGRSSLNPRISDSDWLELAQKFAQCVIGVGGCLRCGRSRRNVRRKTVCIRQKQPSNLIIKQVTQYRLLRPFSLFSLVSLEGLSHRHT